MVEDKAEKPVEVPSKIHDFKYRTCEGASALLYDCMQESGSLAKE